MNINEYQEQCNIFEWAEYATGLHPDLAGLNGSLNGVLYTFKAIPEVDDICRKYELYED